jgi:hypothetical protein
MALIRRFQNIGVTPKEYNLTMPRLLEYAESRSSAGFPDSGRTAQVYNAGSSGDHVDDD